jgi:lysozyme family protein
MKTTFDLIIEDLLFIEGGFANRSRKADPGGPTNWGITQGTLSAWLGRPVSIEEVQDLDRSIAVQIYKSQYWDTVRGDVMPRGLDYALFDFAVNSGPARAIKTLQKILGVAADGVAGVQTLSAVRQHESIFLVNELSAARLAFMKRLKNWPYNKNGWSRRVREVQEKSLALIKSGFVPPVPRVKVSSAIDDGQCSKASPEQTSAVSAWLEPEGLAKAGMAASGFSGILAGSGPLQWGFALALVIAVCVGGWLMIRKAREA